MTDEQIAVELEHHRNEIAGLKRRVGELEDGQKEIRAIAAAVDRLAINMQYMVEEQKKQGEHLATLEGEPTRRARYWIRYILGAIVTALVGLAVGALAGGVLFSAP